MRRNYNALLYFIVEVNGAFVPHITVRIKEKYQMDIDLYVEKSKRESKTYER